MDPLRVRAAFGGKLLMSRVRAPNAATNTGLWFSAIPIPVAVFVLGAPVPGLGL